MKPVKFDHIAALESVSIYQVSVGVWCGDVTFVGDRLYPDGWEANATADATVVGFASADGRLRLTDDEACHDVCAQVARFLLACHALDQQEAMTESLIKRRKTQGGKR